MSFWLLLRVEDTADVQQWKTKGQKSEENNGDNRFFTGVLLFSVVCLLPEVRAEFLHYLNSCHSNIKFTIEFEQNNAIPFLDILVTRIQNNAFMTSIYRKKTFTGLYTKWDSFTLRKYKINLIRSLTYHYYRLCSSGSLLQSALNDIYIYMSGFMKTRLKV